jgi:hypothetical protein
MLYCRLDNVWSEVEMLMCCCQAEKANGRAAMVGYAAALLVDKVTGASLLDQQYSFLGLVLLHITVFGVLLIR